MQIILPSVTMLFPSKEVDVDFQKVIEKAARTCYQSEDKIAEGTDKQLIQKLLNAKPNPHEAMLEFGWAAFRWVCDRGISHEIVRMRLASFAQESTRYVKYNDIEVIKPPGLNGSGYLNWVRACTEAETAYGNMLDAGYAPQIARSVLPTCLKTEINIGANFREWRHICKLRCCKKAHPQIQPLATQTLRYLYEIAPAVFADLAEKYL